ncbi:MAG: molybdopterin cofactor-binding domain-containing protein, partial [Acidimicrobiia bacterium]
MSGSILGNAVKRVEDPRFVRGEGRYLDDFVVEGLLHLVPVRSQVPHGDILSIETDEALAAPGVVAVFTADDLELGTIRQGPYCPRETARPPIAKDRVRFVGEIVAVVVAESEREAADAADLVWADIEPLDAVADIAAATAEGAPVLFPDVGSNVVVDKTGDRAEDLFAEADVVVSAGFHNQRLAAVPIETNNALAEPHDDGTMTLWVGTQNVFGHQPIAKVIGMERSDLRVRMTDMGGGFGAKFYMYPEQVLVAAAAKA